MTNYIKAEIDIRNRIDSLSGDRNETTCYVISKYCEQVEKCYKTRHQWVGKVIRGSFCTKLKFDQTTKW